MDDLAKRLRSAFDTNDLDALRALLADGATWGDDPAAEGFCHSSTDVIERFRQLLAEGVRASVVDTTIGPLGIAVELHVDWPAPEDQRPELHEVHLAFFVGDGRIFAIRGQDDGESALAAISH